MDDVLLGQILAACQPRRIVEIALPGASKAGLILERASDAVLECASDPAIAARFGSRVRQRDGLALNRLASLEGPPDLVLLGGDPNWYTVLHALRLLARASDGAPFPTTVISDAGWPYARRDGYPAPEAVPPAHRQAHAKRGVRPGSADLSEGGLFATRENALFENTDENGVLTAIEEFLEETDLSLERVVVSAFFGTCLLVDRRRLDAQLSLAQLFRELSDPPAPTLALLDALERARVDALVIAGEQGAALERALASHAELLDEVARLREALARAGREEAAQLRIAELEASQSALQEHLARAHAELGEARATEAGPRMDDAAYAAPKPRRSNGAGPRGPISRMIAGTASLGMLKPGDLALARRRLAKLRRDPKLFLAHSRFGVARRLARLL